MDISSLLKTLGPRLGVPDLALSDAGTARLAVDNGVVVDLELHDATLGQDSGRLHAFAVVRRLAGNALQAWAPTLLAAHMMGQQTAGASFWLDEATGEVLLGQSWALDALAPDADATVADAIQALARQTQAWRERLQGPRPDLLPRADEVAQGMPPTNAGLTAADLVAAQAQRAGSLPGLPPFAIRG
jgi:hypothetical protein